MFGNNRLSRTQKALACLLVLAFVFQPASFAARQTASAAGRVMPALKEALSKLEAEPSQASVEPVELPDVRKRKIASAIEKLFASISFTQDSAATRRSRAAVGAVGTRTIRGPVLFSGWLALRDGGLGPLADFAGNDRAIVLLNPKDRDVEAQLEAVTAFNAKLPKARKVIAVYTPQSARSALRLSGKAAGAAFYAYVSSTGDPDTLRQQLEDEGFVVKSLSRGDIDRMARNSLFGGLVTRLRNAFAFSAAA